MYLKIRYIATICDGNNENSCTAYFYNSKLKYLFPFEINYLFLRPDQDMNECNFDHRHEHNFYDLYIKTCKAFGIEVKSIMIFKKVAGVIYSYISLEQRGKRFEIFTKLSNALRIFHKIKCPVYIKESQIRSLGIKINKRMVINALKKDQITHNDGKLYLRYSEMF